MQNTFEQVNEILAKLEATCISTSFPSIERDIILEKLRKIYSSLQSTQPSTDNNNVTTSEQYEVYQGLTEDVDLFFDTDHESYNQQAEIKKEILSIKENEEATKAAELKRLEEEEKRKQEEARIAEEKRIAEERRLKEEEDLRKKQEEERLKAMEAERKLAEERRIKEEEQRKKKEEEMLKAAEEKRLADERKRVEIEQKQREEAQRKANEQSNAQSQPADEDDLLQFIPKAQSQATPTKPLAQHTQKSLNDLFNEQREDHSLSAQFQKAKVSDLTKAISINDKFTFIKELFNNKGEEFSAAITKLNQCTSMEEAVNCLETFKQTFFWDSTSTAYLSLCDLVRRKFN